MEAGTFPFPNVTRDAKSVEVSASDRALISNGIEAKKFQKNWITRLHPCSFEEQCGAIATIIFWGNLRRYPSGRLAIAMTCSTGFAFLLAIAGWLWLPKVENDRIKRAELTDQIFLQKDITKLDVTVIPNALQALKDFLRSHLISLGMNMLCGLGML